MGAGYIHRAGVALDRLLNVILWNGDDGQTISEHAAADLLAGKRIGRWACWLLSLLIERGHCEKVSAGAYVQRPIVSFRIALALLCVLAMLAATANMVETILYRLV